MFGTLAAVNADAALASASYPAVAWGACLRAALAWAVFVLALRLVAPLKKKSATVLVVLGSGGHTAEMVAVLGSLERHSHAFDVSHKPHHGAMSANVCGSAHSRAMPVPAPRQLQFTYVVAASDKTSVAKVRVTAQEVGRAPPPASSFATIPRSREVRQSWFTSAFTTAAACVHAALLVSKKRPDVILCNGPGTCVPVCLSAFVVCRVLRLNPGCRQLFVESFCRVKSLSLTGRMLYLFVDRFFVQWTELLASHRGFCKLEHAGCIT